jgi:CheY-like chemotaxis protein
MAGREARGGRVMDSHAGALAGLQILLVEDNRDAQQILTMLLTYCGAWVTSARTATGGLKALRRMLPHVVVSDVRLPDHDAIWLVDAARTHGIRVPFIAVSGLDFDESHLVERGFVTYLRKPVDHARLVAAILAAGPSP